MDENRFKQYYRKGTVEMRPYVPGEDLTGISLSKFDDPLHDLGLIARNPENHKDQWYVARKHFELWHFPANAASRPIDSTNRMNEHQFKQYYRKGIVEMRPYVPGEDLTGISLSKFDDPLTDLGLIAHDPENHKDQWYVPRKHFEEYFEAA